MPTGFKTDMATKNCKYDENPHEDVVEDTGSTQEPEIPRSENSRNANGNGEVATVAMAETMEPSTGSGLGNVDHGTSSKIQSILGKLRLRMRQTEQKQEIPEVPVVASTSSPSSSSSSQWTYGMMKSMSIMFERAYGRTDYIVQYMRQEPDCVWTQQQGLEAIADILEGNGAPQNVDQLIEVTISTMRNHARERSIQREGVKAIANMFLKADSASEESQREAMGIMLSSLTFHAKECVDITKVLLESLNKIAKKRKTKMEKALVEGILSSMQLYGTRSIDIQREACALLYHLSHSQLHMFREDDKLQGAVFFQLGYVMDFFLHDDPILIENIIGAFMNFSSHGISGKMKRLIVQNHVPTMYQAVEAHVRSLGVQEKLCATISNLSTHLAGSAHAIQVVSRSVDSFPNEARLAELGCLAIQNLIYFKPARSALDRSIVQILTKVMTRFPHDHNVQYFSILSFINLVLIADKHHETCQYLKHETTLLSLVQEAFRWAHERNHEHLQAEAQGLLDLLY